jgi:predicted porin
MKKIGVAAASAAVVILTGAGGAYAADLPTKAAPAAAGPATCTGFADFFTTACQLAWYGVRFYGTLDVGGSYMTHGTPFDPISGVGYFPIKDSRVRGFVLAPNALSGSNVGLQVKESLFGTGWNFIGQLEMGFNPYSQTISNNTGSVQEGIGFNLNNEKTPADGSSNGQFYTNLGYAGISHDTWGTLTFGRQLDLGRETVISYDPMGSSLGFSYIGFFGATAGEGQTENARGNTAVKYKVNFGNFHAGVFSQIGSYENGNASQGVIQGNIGTDFRTGPGLLSVDATAGHTKGAIGEALANPAGTVSGTTGVVLNPFAPQHLAVSIQDTTGVMLAAKYTWDRLKLYAGYEWIQFAAPSDPVTAFRDAGGVFLQNGVPLNGFNVVIAPFSGPDKIQQTAWVGARYSVTDSLDAAVAYYHADFSQTDTSGNCDAHFNTANANCHGWVDAASFLLDWRFAPKWDTYIGTLYSKFQGGQASGYLLTTPGGTIDNWATTAGIRFRW